MTLPRAEGLQESAVPSHNEWYVFPDGAEYGACEAARWCIPLPISEPSPSRIVLSVLPNASSDLDDVKFMLEYLLLAAIQTGINISRRADAAKDEEGHREQIPDPDELRY